MNIQPTSAVLSTSHPILNPYSEQQNQNANQIDQLNFQNQQQQKSYLKLPLSIRVWAYHEQANNPKSYDPDFYPKPSETSLPHQYMPENRSILQLEAWRMPDQYLDGLSTEKSQFDDQFNNQDGTHTLLVHPSINNTALMQRLGAQLSHDKYYFIPLASPRTGITWKVGNEQHAFISKMTINPTRVGGMQIAQVKSDLGLEGKMSVTKTTCLEHLYDDPNNYYLDQYSIQLHPALVQQFPGMTSYGVLFRKIPNPVLDSAQSNIPFFALASKNKDPLITSLIKKSGLTIEDYLNYYICNPVADFILDNTKSGIYPDHLHGQNLLIKAVTDSSLSNGIKQLIPKVIYRDVADLKISKSSETIAFNTFRNQQGGRECTFSPGSYAYEAATQFLICSLGPIINVIIEAQKNGQLPPELYGTTNKDSACLSFMHNILSKIKDEIKSNNHSVKQHAYNTLYEFACMAITANNIFKNTPRERLWQNSIKNISGRLYQDNKNLGTVDQTRKNKLMEHIQDYTQESAMKYIALDQERGINPMFSRQNHSLGGLTPQQPMQFISQTSMQPTTVTQPINFWQQAQNPSFTTVSIECPMQSPMATTNWFSP